MANDKATAKQNPANIASLSFSISILYQNKIKAMQEEF